jgi:hypothetical protein
MSNFPADLNCQKPFGHNLSGNSISLLPFSVNSAGTVVYISGRRSNDIGFSLVLKFARGLERTPLGNATHNRRICT